LFTARAGVGFEREHLVYCAGAAGVVVHAVDHLVSDPEWGFWFTTAVVLSVVTAAIGFVYPWLRPGWREATAIPLGLMWAGVAFVHHVVGLFVGGAAPTDYTGIAAAIGGGLMVAAGLMARSARRASAGFAPTER
jgi:zinc transporter ZupT